MALTLSQGLHGIHPACGECGQIARQCRHEKQDRGSAEQTQRIGRAEAEEHARERAADKKGDRQAEADTDGDQRHALAQHEPQNIPAQTSADTELRHLAFEDKRLSRKGGVVLNMEVPTSD